jgi:hypothetical protein
MTELTPEDLYTAARKARDEAQKQFDDAVPGWPDRMTKPVGPAGMQAHRMLRAREKELTAARGALLRSKRQAQ